MKMVEIIMVVIIVTFLLATMINAYGQFTDRTRMNATAENIVTLIQKARSNTLASKDNSFYSIHVEEAASTAAEKNFLQVFRANDYWSTTAPSKRLDKFTMPSGIEISSVNLQAGTTVQQPVNKGGLGQACYAGSICDSGLTCDSDSFCKQQVTKTYAYVLENSYGGASNDTRLIVIDTDSEHSPSTVPVGPVPSIVGRSANLFGGVGSWKLVAIDVDIQNGNAYIIANNYSDSAGGKLIKCTNIKSIIPDCSTIVSMGANMSGLVVKNNKIYIAFAGSPVFPSYAAVPYFKVYSTGDLSTPLVTLTDTDINARGAKGITIDSDDYVYTQVYLGRDAFPIINPSTWTFSSNVLIPAGYSGGSSYQYNPTKIAIRHPDARTLIYSINDMYQGAWAPKRRLSVINVVNHALPWTSDPHVIYDTGTLYNCSGNLDYCQYGFYVDDNGEYIYTVGTYYDWGTSVLDLAKSMKFTITRFNAAANSLTLQNAGGYPSSGYMPASAIKVLNDRAYIPVRDGSNATYTNLGKFTVFDVSNKSAPVPMGGSICTSADDSHLNDSVCPKSTVYDMDVKTFTVLQTLTCNVGATNNGKGGLDQQCCTSPDPTACPGPAAGLSCIALMCVNAPPTVSGRNFTYKRIAGDVALVDPTNLTNGTTTPATACSPKIIIKSTKSNKAKKISILTTGTLQVEDSEYTCKTFLPTPDPAEDGVSKSIQSATWKPISNQSNVWSGNTITGPEHQFQAGFYRISVGLLKFDTSLLPDCVIIQSAALKLYIEQKVGSRTFAVEYYPTSLWPPMAADDWTTTPANDAHTGTNVSSIIDSVWNSFSLTNFSSITKPTVGFRSHLMESAAPAGDNYIRWRSGEHPTEKPQLEVCYY